MLQAHCTSSCSADITLMAANLLLGAPPSSVAPRTLMDRELSFQLSNLRRAATSSACSRDVKSDSRRRQSDLACATGRSTAHCSEGRKRSAPRNRGRRSWTQSAATGGQHHDSGPTAQQLGASKRQCLNGREREDRVIGGGHCGGRSVEHQFSPQVCSAEGSGLTDCQCT
jgi:hypothetical protein